MKYKILVVEDQKEISDILSLYLEKEGYDYIVASDGFQALEFFGAEKIHLVLLDIMMPGIDGFSVIKEIRDVSDVPVIMVSAREDESDRIKGFDLGADDYVVKPFSSRELMRRIKALLKRSYPDIDGSIMSYKDLSLECRAMKLYKNSEEIDITRAEFCILKAFFKNHGQVLSREQIIEQAFEGEYDGFDRSMDTYIKRLRQKIEDDPKSPQYIVTKYGAGYIFGGD